MEEPPPLSRDEQFRMFLASSDEACPGCGYSLRGLTGMRCPECNQELKLQVGLVEPRLGAFIAGLVGLSMGAGFGILVYGAVAVRAMVSGGGPPMRDGLPILLMGVFCAGLVWAWVKGRRRLQKQTDAVRWSMAIGAFVVSIGLAVLCVIVVR